MKFHSLTLNWIAHHEVAFVVGLVIGRVNYRPAAQWLYSIRLILGVFKVELLWKTGVRKWHCIGIDHAQEAKQ